MEKIGSRHLDLHINLMSNMHGAFKSLFISIFLFRYCSELKRKRLEFGNGFGKMKLKRKDSGNHERSGKINESILPPFIPFSLHMHIKFTVMV